MSTKAALKHKVKVSLAKYVRLSRNNCSYSKITSWQPQNHLFLEF